jgi:hypothetical protein
MFNMHVTLARRITRAGCPAITEDGDLTMTTPNDPRSHR